jgi:hypothetical protein
VFVQRKKAAGKLDSRLGSCLNFASGIFVSALMRMTVARLLLTAVLLGGATASFVLDWSANHLLNPAWHGHARFHGALLLFLLAGVSLTGVWLLWRRSKEPNVAITAAALISASFWTPLFYITYLLPGSTAWAGDPAAIPHLGGRVFLPNLAVAAGFLTVTAAAWLVGRES